MLEYKVVKERLIGSGFATYILRIDTNEFVFDYEYDYEKTPIGINIDDEKLLLDDYANLTPDGNGKSRIVFYTKLGKNLLKMKDLETIICKKLDEIIEEQIQINKIMEEYKIV